MTPKLYMSQMCPSVRSVLLTARLLEVTLDVREDKLRGWIAHECGPVLEDHGFIIWDNDAINSYLIGKYGRNDELYPANKKVRSIIDDLLQYNADITTIFTNKILKPLACDGDYVVCNAELHVMLDGAYDKIDKFLRNGNGWIAGDTVTLADLCLIPTLTSFDLLYKIDKKSYPNVIDWIKRAERMPWYDSNRVGLNKLREFFKNKLPCTL